MAARGRFLARMDSDDVLHQDRLLVQLQYIEKYNLDFLGSWAIVIDSQGKKIGEIKTPKSESEIKQSIMIHNPIVHPSLFIKKSVFIEAGGYADTAKYNEDYDLYFRLLKLGKSCANVPMSLVFLRENQCSITRGRSWIVNRLNYQKVKLLAVLKYGHHSFIDVAFAIATLPSVLVAPEIVVPIKRVIGNFHPNQNN